MVAQVAPSAASSAAATAAGAGRAGAGARATSSGPAAGTSSPAAPAPASSSSAGAPTSSTDDSSSSGGSSSSLPNLSPGALLNRDLPGPVEDGAGLLLGIFLYALALNFLQGGAGQVRRWIAAKFINKVQGRPSPGGFFDGGPGPSPTVPAAGDNPANPFGPAAPVNPFNPFSRTSSDGGH